MNTVNKNKVTGYPDVLNGDYSFKNFLKKQWDWALIWLLFFVISILQITHIPTIIGWINESIATDGVAGAIFVIIGMIIWIPACIGITIFLRRWWLELGGWRLPKGTIKK